MSELKITGISKSYGKKKALNDFSVTLSEGIYALLGPNGAGKTTLMNILTDNLKADSGSVTYNGENIIKMGAEYRAKIGYMPQHQGMYKSFTVIRFLWYMAALKGMKKEEAGKRIEKVLSAVDLTDASTKKIGALSGGMLQRLGLAQAVLGDPEILILDEPTAGLDPMQRINLRNFIANIALNKIVLIATHVVSDIEYIAKDIMILKEGVLLGCASAQSYIKQVENKVWHVTIPSAELIPQVQKKYKVGNIFKENESIILKVISDEKPDMGDVTSAPATLEDYYLHTFDVTGGGLQ